MSTRHPQSSGARDPAVTLTIANTYLCNFAGCGKSFSHDSSLSRHKRLCHPDAEVDSSSFTCQVCNRPFSSQRGLSIHRNKSGHAAEPPLETAPADPQHICSFCAKVYPSSVSLRNHVSNAHYKDKILERSSKVQPRTINNVRTEDPAPAPQEPCSTDPAQNFDNRKRLPQSKLAIMTHSNWAEIAREAAPYSEALLHFPTEELSEEEWSRFVTTVTSLNEVLYAQAELVSTTICATADRLYLLKEAHRTVRRSIKAANKIQLLLATRPHQTAEVEKLLQKIPLHIRIMLPSIEDRLWTSKWKSVKQQLQKANSKLTRKLCKRMSIEQEQQLVKLFNVDPKKAVNQIFTNSDPAPQCSIPLQQLEVEYRKITSAPGVTVSIPSWLSSLPWPNVPSDEEDKGSPITAKEVQAQLKRLPLCSSPGPDGIPYLVYKRVPKCEAVLAHIYEVCRINRKVPPDWNISKTILLYKKGNPNEISNWRPISLQNAIYKIYAAVLAKRLVNWSINHSTFSRSQKGFLPSEGCHEHTYVLRSVFEDSQRWKKPLYAIWYDLKNAFGSVSHTLIALMMRMLRIPKYMQEVIVRLYRKAVMYLCTKKGNSTIFNMQRGVKQGCPLSPLIFNMCIEGLLRYLQTKKGYQFNSDSTVSLSHEAYADDLVTLAGTSADMDEMFQMATKFMKWAQVDFGVSKCASLGITYKSGMLTLDQTDYRINGEKIPCLKVDEAYKYLGTGIGILGNKEQIDNIITEVTKKVTAIAASCLEPWQKIMAIKVFALPKLYFHFMNSHVSNKVCRKLDRMIYKSIRQILNLPISAATAQYTTRMSEGGFALRDTDKIKETYKIVFALKILDNTDPLLRRIAQVQIMDAQTKRNIKLLREGHSNFFNWKVKDGAIVAKTRTQDSTNMWWKVAKLLIKYKLKCYKRNDTVMVDTGTTLYPIHTAKRLVHKDLQKEFADNYRKSWDSKPSQGRVMRYVVTSPLRNQILRNSKGITEAMYKFLVKYQLSLLPTRTVHRRYNPALSATCRLCGQHAETQNHILGHCVGVKPEITNRHNNICAMLEKELCKYWPTVKIDQTVGHNALRPDIQLINEQTKQFNIIELSVSYEDFENQSLTAASTRKKIKYTELCDELRQRGYKVKYCSLTVGYSGTYETSLPQEYADAAAVGIRTAQQHMKSAITLAIKGSYAIWRRWTDCVLHSALY